jgi:hypothetical protein
MSNPTNPVEPASPCRKVPPVYVPLSARVSAAEQLRDNRATAQAGNPAPQPCNGDESDFPTYVANFSKSLQKDTYGVVVPAAYQALLAALTELHVCAFDRHLEDPQTNPTVEQLGTIPIANPPPNNVLIYQVRNNNGQGVGDPGARLLLDNPLAPEAFSLEGADPQTVGIYDFRPPANGAATGYTPAIIALPAPPKFNSETELAEIVENYYMALLRDVPFKYYTAAGRNEDVQRGILSQSLANTIAALVDGAVADLGGPSGFYFGRNYEGGDNGNVTEQTLFRGFTEGDRVGPYVSQFFVRPVPEGRLTVNPKIKTAAMRQNYGGDPTTDPNATGRDYLTVTDLWRERQRGYVRTPAPLNTVDPNFDEELRLIRAGRDAGEYVHADVVFQEYLNACFILFTTPSPRTNFPRDAVYNELDPSGAALPFEGGLFDPQQTLAPEIPYQFSHVEKGFITLGNHDLKSMIGEVGRRALLTVWYYKWNIHRRLRPEEFAGRIDREIRGGQTYPFYQNVNLLTFPITKTVLPLIAQSNSTDPQDEDANGKIPNPEASYYLPQQFPEGCPIHPSYCAGHATTAGACVTLLKAFFNDDLPLANLKHADSSGNLSTFFVPVQPAADGRTLEVYPESDAAQMTIGGELNKLASNVSLFRNHAGVHWRSDHTYSLLLGEAVAIDYLLDIVNTYAEEGTGTDSYANPPTACDSRPPLSFTLRTFEGYRIRIAPSGSNQVPAGVTVIEQPPAGSHDLSGIYNPVYP